VTTGAVSARAQELAAEGTAFVVATVVRAQRPTSVKAGDAALVLADGTIEGFVGGVCTEHSVRAYSLQALETGEALLLRILPDGTVDDDDGAGLGASNEEGAVTVQNTCLSGGGIEVFLEPVLPAPRVLVVGDSPIAAALVSLAPALGFHAIAVDGGSPEPAEGDLAVVVASHGRDELHLLRRALEAEVPYVGLVASRKRGAGVLGQLRADGVSDQHLELIDVPAGIDIGAQTPAEVALSIFASVIAVRRRSHAETPDRPHEPVAPAADDSAPSPLAIDPICGMTVAAVATTPSVKLDGETIYFCCDGCRSAFLAQHENAVAAD
jgi:xanthine dehydrogenase accessory factor